MVRSHHDFHSVWHSCIDLQAHKAVLESNLKSYMAFRDSRKRSTLPLVPLLTYVADIASLTADKAWVTKWSAWHYRSLCVNCMQLQLVPLTDFSFSQLRNRLWWMYRAPPAWECSLVIHPCQGPLVCLFIWCVQHTVQRHLANFRMSHMRCFFIDSSMEPLIFQSCIEYTVSSDVLFSYTLNVAQ